MSFGQTSHAGTRIHINAKVYDGFIKLCKKRIQAIQVGDNFDGENEQGPKNSKMQYDKILGCIAEGKKESATVALGGNPKKIGDGYFIEPTIFNKVPPDMKIMREEILGPVVCVSKFSSEDEVIEPANDTTYGFAAGNHNKNYGRAVRVTGALKAGTTWMHMFNFVHWSMHDICTVLT